MALKNHSLSGAPRETSRLAPLSAYSEKELLELRSQIDTMLGLGSLADLDIGQEIVLQYRTLKILQHEALKDDEAPHGQKAQASMTVSRMLSELAKSRQLLYGAERIKQIELMTIEAIKECPDDAKEAFFERLERYLATLPSLSALMAEASESE
jgi:hypothetical protein